MERELQSLDEKKLFENKAEIEFSDAERLKSTFRELIRKSVKEITFNNHVALPDMPEALNVRQSFIGSIQVNSYLDLITNDEGNLSKGLFYDNVRDYQGSNKVNREIHETLNSKLWQNLLPLLNNGITIISKKVDKVGSKLKLSDFQIVNGCQSSHVLFENKAVVGDNTHIVIKVIETNDQDVINKIIRATNRQTEVKDEAFESLKPFHKDLEEFYKAKSNSIPYPIYYERRSKEYLGDPKVKPVQVITLASQIKSYVSLVLEQPQSTHRYFGELLESNESRLFSNTKNLSEYYLSALIVNRLEALFRGRSRGGIFNYKAFKYHISFLTYILIKKEFGEDKDKLISLSSDKGRLKPFFDKSIDLITKALRETSLNKRDAIRNREFAVRIKEKALSL
ncbi:AIPR family protein [Aeromonas dhakensis]|nr:AIPR family protein [Aeromonas dhakensis]